MASSVTPSRGNSESRERGKRGRCGRGGDPFFKEVLEGRGRSDQERWREERGNPLRRGSTDSGGQKVLT